VSRDGTEARDRADLSSSVDSQKACVRGGRTLHHYDHESPIGGCHVSGAFHVVRNSLRWRAHRSRPPALPPSFCAALTTNTIRQYTFAMVRQLWVRVQPEVLP